MTARFGSRALWIALAATTAYAVVRYNLVKGVPYAQLPLYVANKALAWSSVTLWLVALLRVRGSRRAAFESAGFAEGTLLAGAHVLVSLLIEGPGQYPELFDEHARHTLRGGVAMACGVAGCLALLGLRKNAAAALALPWLVAAHAAALGYPTWLTPAGWPAYLAPITLLATATSLGVALLASARRP